AFFDRAANRAALATADAANVEALLRTRRYRVERFADGATTYLFADRFAWAQIGSFVSHLAVLLLLAGGFITWTGSYTTALFIPEGATQPVFPVRHANQMQVKVVDAIGSFDKTGTPLDYRSKLVIYQDGHEVARGVATVNDPLTYNGYRFHQAAYFGDGAALRVRDVASGNTIFREVLALRDLWPAPAIAVRDAQGQVLLRDTIVPTEQLEGVWGTPMTVPGTGQDFWVGVRQDQQQAWQLVVLGLNDDRANAVIPSGQSGQAGDLRFTFRSVDGLPFVAAPSDGAPAIPGDEKRSVVILAKTPEGTPYLTVRGAVASSALTLFPNEPVRVGNREYVFEGRREFAGIQVRKDPGSMFIWVGVGVLLAGLAITFYVPRMRLWLRIRGDETVIAAQAERNGGFRSETRQLARALRVRLTSGEEESDA
ncbi:MAG: cytochrome c biogenesis protein ResB, partial [Dehalococcoidia bacterium]